MATRMHGFSPTTPAAHSNKVTMGEHISAPINHTRKGLTMKKATEMLGHQLAATYYLVCEGTDQAGRLTGSYCAGRIDTCYSHTHSHCTATVRIWAGPWAGESSTCRARCQSSAVSHALQVLNQGAHTELGTCYWRERLHRCDGRGMPTIRKVVEEAGYLWCGD